MWDNCTIGTQKQEKIVPLVISIAHIMVTRLHAFVVGMICVRKEPRGLVFVLFAFFQAERAYPVPSIDMRGEGY